MNKTIEILKAVSDPTRLRILMSLSGGELCVCRITALLYLAASTISKHMSILKHAGLVESRKSGKWIFYKLCNNADNNFTINLMSLVRNEIEEDTIIKTDSCRLKKIVQMTHEELCTYKNEDCLNN